MMTMEEKTEVGVVVGGGDVSHNEEKSKVVVSTKEHLSTPSILEMSEDERKVIEKRLVRKIDLR